MRNEAFNSLSGGMEGRPTSAYRRSNSEDSAARALPRKGCLSSTWEVVQTGFTRGVFSSLLM